jgi:uncharacterized protein (DUF433 family)/DNA-binding transcriptional MerR regulator
MVKSTESLRFGVGLYSIRDAARLLQVPVGTVRRWISVKDGVVTCTFDLHERTLTFLELMELHFIKLFRDQNVSLQTIRKAAKTAEKRFGNPHPFALHRFDTDGRTIFATLIGSEKRLVEDLRHGQYVFDTVVRPFFKKLEYSQDRAIRFWPLGVGQRVVLDPERQFGTPIDDATAVPTSALFLAVQAGDDPVAVAQWFKVPLAAVRAAIAFEQPLAA